MRTPAPPGDTNAPVYQPARGIDLEFNRSVPMHEVEDTLQLALLAAESVHGAEQVALDDPASVDRRGQRVVIDTSTPPGHTTALVFLGYVRREFGSEVVRVKRFAAAAEIAGAA